MTEFLVRTFVKDRQNREQMGKLAGWVGLLSNIFLFLIKLLVGIITSSISIMTDAINNLADGSSSLITIVGFRIAAAPADKEHPYGHARVEYLSGLLVAAIVFLIGGQFFISSVKKTLQPEATSLTKVAVFFLLLSIGIKVWQSLFNKKIGDEIFSTILIATSIDSRNDVFITFVVLLSSVLEFLFGWKLDGPMGILVSLVVMYSGVELVRDTIAPLLGSPPSPELMKFIKGKIRSYPKVLDTHDVLVHNYGPERYFVTAHVEMSATIPVLESHEILDSMERDFLKKHGIDLVVHMDPIDTSDPQWIELENVTQTIVKDLHPALSIHGFRLVRGKEYIRFLFDVTVPPDLTITDDEIRDYVTEKLKERDESHEVIITIDRNFVSTVN